MNSYKSYLFISISWILSLGVAFTLGWWKGISGAARIATNVASSSLPLVIGLIAVVALIAGFAAFRVRGSLSSRSHP